LSDLFTAHFNGRNISHKERKENKAHIEFSETPLCFFVFIVSLCEKFFEMSYDRKRMIQFIPANHKYYYLHFHAANSYLLFLFKHAMIDETPI